MKNANNRFSLGSNLQDNNLYRKMSVKAEEGGTTAAEVSLKTYGMIFFDVIHEIHVSVSHSLYSRTQREIIDKHWWGLPENAIKMYIRLCLECISTHRPPAAESLHPLKIMISTTIGKCAQMDLID